MQPKAHGLNRGLGINAGFFLYNEFIHFISYFICFLAVFGYTMI
jgi:hypothetical protein